MFHKKNFMHLLVTLVLMLFIIHSPLLKAQSYSQNGGTATETNQTYTANKPDTSGVFVTGGGSLTLTNSTITATGNTTSNDSSSFYGLNAGVLANSASTIILEGCRVTTSGTGANGVFASGSGSSITLKNDTITCTNDGGHGIDATLGAVLSLTNVVINTAGAHGAAIATDRGGGTIIFSGGSATASGQDSPGIYSTGDITISGATVSGTGAEGAVIEGANTITLTNTNLSGAVGTRDRGIMIYQSMSGDAQGVEGTYTMTGGSYTWTSTSGPAFYVTNSTGIISLKDVAVNNSSKVLIKAAADQWGNSGSNGGTVNFTADSESLTGNLVADNISSINLTLQNNSSLTGAVDSANTASSIKLSLDGTSIWNVSANSYITSLSDADGISGTSITNINGNGHIVYYDANASANSALGGETYSLNNGGYLKPGGTTAVKSESSSAPTNWVLNQNYPNPFNPSTKISFYLKKSGNAQLKVYDITGREVSTLFEGFKSAGSYSVVFDASKLSSGVYIYKLTASGFMQTKKMILMK